MEPLPRQPWDPEIEALVESLVPRAKALAYRAWQKAPSSLERAELESIAYEGLVQAASMWPGYCRRNSFDPAAYHYFGAYAGRRMTGAILDYLRSVDWVTRVNRQRVKKMALVMADGSPRTEAQLASAAGLTVSQVRDTTAALARRPVSIDDGEREFAQPENTESSALTAAILSAASLAGDSMTPIARTVMALWYFARWEPSQIARALGIPLPELSAMRDNSLRAVHSAMALAAAG